MKFVWQGDALKAHVRHASLVTMTRLEGHAFDTFNVIAPVGSDPRRTKAGYVSYKGGWFSRVIPTPNGVRLVFGSRARHALVLEFGRRDAKMAGRSPLRRVAGIIWPGLSLMLMDALNE